MPGVDRPAIETGRRREAPVFLSLLRCVVMRLAKRLEWTIPKFLGVAVMAINVIANRGRRSPPLLPAEPTERLSL
ncbi:hypothetical protein ACRQ1B_28880 [Rhizobium panacihumi]|uniref:hypothetical protein n=1 Tax=Rhizobium panacihumi TaxID=2008450 RepID=UPI003D792F42